MLKLRLEELHVDTFDPADLSVPGANGSTALAAMSVLSSCSAQSNGTFCRGTYAAG